MIDYDRDAIMELNSYETFDLAPRENEKEFREVVLSPIVDRRIEKAIVETLEEKGFVRNPGGAEFMVSFDTITKTKTSVEAFSISTGNSLRGPPYGTIETSTISTRDYEEGTFIIDIIDPISDELVWRGALSRRLDKEAPDQEKIQQIVTTILDRFPPLLESPNP